MPAPLSLRLFLALPCPAPLTGRIAAWRDGLNCAGKPVHPADLHLTLVFLGSRPADWTTELCASLDRLALPPAFALRLDKLDCWRGGLLHLAPRNVPGGLITLQTRLVECLTGMGIEPEPRVFRPHLTLLRDCAAPTETPQPTFDWPVDRFTLFASQMAASGPRYRSLAQWQLPPPTDA